MFKLGDAQASAGKEELMPAVLRHWQNQVRCRFHVQSTSNSPCPTSEAHHDLFQHAPNLS